MSEASIWPLCSFLARQLVIALVFINVLQVKLPLKGTAWSWCWGNIAWGVETSLSSSLIADDLDEPPLAVCLVSARPDRATLSHRFSLRVISRFRCFKCIFLAIRIYLFAGLFQTPLAATFYSWSLDSWELCSWWPPHPALIIKLTWLASPSHMPLASWEIYKATKRNCWAGHQRPDQS